jgi:hypothetical protein
MRAVWPRPTQIVVVRPIGCVLELADMDGPIVVSVTSHESLLSLFFPPSPLFVLLTSLRSAQANTHAFIFCLSQIFIRPRINSHPTLIVVPLFLSQ